MKVSVVVCAYTMDRWDDLSSAINSVLAQKGGPYETVLVCDYNDELYARATEAFPTIRVVPNSLSKGLSGARNTGVDATTGDIVAFLDDDATAEPTWLEALCAPFEDPGVFCVGGWVEPRFVRNAPWFPASFYWVFGCSYRGLPTTGGTLRNPIGASMALRRSVFVAVGGFTTGLGRIGKTLLGCEETELCIRYQRVNSTERVVHQTSSIVHHRVGAERVSLRYLLRRCWSEGLSKAVVTDLVGMKEGLASERRQMVLVLPQAVLKALAHAVRRPRTGLTELVFVVGGTVAAVTGYLRGRLSVAVGLGVTPTDPWLPIPIVQVDADGGPDQVPVSGADRVWVEVLRQGQIVQRALVPVTNGMLSPIALERLRHSVTSTPVSRPQDIESWPKVTVVVPSICRDVVQVRDAVAGLVALDYPDFEVVVVDNRREPLAEPFPHLSDDPRVRVVRQAIPGASAARNRGIEVATGDIVAFTDDDAQVSPQWLRAFARRFAQDPALAGVGGMVQPIELTYESQLWFEEYYGGFTPNFAPFDDAIDRSTRDPLFPYAVGRFGAGCNMAMRRDALVAVGGFRYELGPGTPARAGEDLELWIALASAGYTIGFEPAALVRHTHRATRDDFFEQIYGYGIGLSAMYLSVLLSHPRHLVEVVRRIPYGLRRLGSARRGRRHRAPRNYPLETLKIETRGMLRGPVLLWHSRRLFRGLALPAGALTGERPKGRLVPRAPDSRHSS